MRAVVLSSTYILPQARGKLKALAGLGVALSAGVPERWPAEQNRGTLTATWGDDGGVRIVPIPVSGTRWSGRAIRRLFTDFRPDIVQIEDAPGNQLAAAASRQAARLGVPAVLFSWESVAAPDSLGRRWRRARTMQRVRGLIGGNRIAAGLLAKDRADLPLTVIPQLGIVPPLDVHRAEHAGLSIGFVGRLVPERGLDILFRACVKLLGRWSLTVAGTGPAQEELEHLAERLGIAARITWLGAVAAADRARLWPSLDCLVVPSRTTQRWVETFHTPLIEAMGHGVAVIGSDSGGIPELIDTAGLIVPEDDVAALTAALQHLADSPRERQRFGREGRYRVMHEYVDEAVARRTIEFWERVLGSRPELP